jgi:hypothetical protein
MTWVAMIWSVVSVCPGANPNKCFQKTYHDYNTCIACAHQIFHNVLHAPIKFFIDRYQ